MYERITCGLLLNGRLKGWYNSFIDKHDMKHLTPLALRGFYL
jgi:hypothetical protein